jgi:predicted transcriptional regulator
MKAEEKIIYVPEFMLSLIAMDENKGGSISDLHYKLKISYAFLHGMKKMFVSKGWISIQKEGLKHIPIITQKGKVVLNDIYKLLEDLEIKKEDVFSHRVLRRQQKLDKAKEADIDVIDGDEKDGTKCESTTDTNSTSN